MATTKLTFKQWSAKGYKINKGAKCCGWDKELDAALFSEEQVTRFAPRPCRSYRSYNPSDFDREADAEEADYYGIDVWGGD